MTSISFIAEPGKQEIITTHRFDAPRELVFKAHTDPTLIPRWWGPKSLTTSIDLMDVRPGGAWRFVQQDQDGHQYAFHGIYHEIVPAQRLVYTFEFEGMPGHVLLEALTFEQQDGSTRLIGHSVFQSVDDRDGMLYSGMQIGSSCSMESLAELLVEHLEKA